MARFENIIIDNERYPIAFGMGVLLRFCRAIGLRLDQFLANIEEITNNPDYLETLVFLAFEQGHRSAGVEMKIQKADVLNVSASTYSEYMHLINKGMQGDGGNPEGAIEEGNGKKKTPKPK